MSGPRKKSEKFIAGYVFVSYLFVVSTMIISPCVMGAHETDNTLHDGCHENLSHETDSFHHDCDMDHCNVCEIRNVEITIDKIIVDINKISFKKYDYPVLDNYTALNHLQSHHRIHSVDLHEQFYPPLHPLVKYRRLLI